MDVVAAVTGTVFIYYWITRALTRPIAPARPRHAPGRRAATTRCACR